MHGRLASRRHDTPTLERLTPLQLGGFSCEEGSKALRTVYSPKLYLNRRLSRGGGATVGRLNTGLDRCCPHVFLPDDRKQLRSQPDDHRLYQRGSFCAFRRDTAAAFCWPACGLALIAVVYSYCFALVLDARHGCWRATVLSCRRLAHADVLRVDHIVLAIFLAAVAASLIAALDFPVPGLHRAAAGPRQKVGLIYQRVSQLRHRRAGGLLHASSDDARGGKRRA